MAKKKKDTSIRNNVTIFHLPHKGGELTVFEELIEEKISDLTPDFFYVKTKIGYLLRSTYDYISTTTNRTLLESVRCKKCKNYVIMSSEAVQYKDVETCPVCNKSLY